MSDTHSAHIIGNDFSAFIDGIPDQCKHKWDGEVHYLVESKNDETFIPIWVKESEILSIYPGKDKAEKMYAWYDTLKEREQWNSTGCVCCSKCGKLFEPDLR